MQILNCRFAHSSYHMMQIDRLLAHHSYVNLFSVFNLISHFTLFIIVSITHILDYLLSLVYSCLSLPLNVRPKAAARYVCFAKRDNIKIQRSKVNKVNSACTLWLKCFMYTHTYLVKCCMPRHSRDKSTQNWNRIVCSS